MESQKHLVDENLSPYLGKPFVGIHKITRDNVPNDEGLRSYCLLLPTTDKDIGGMHGIPVDAYLRYPYVKGIESLVRLVQNIFGRDYNPKVTFEPPAPRKSGCKEFGYCTVTFQSLHPQELDEFHRLADE